MPELWEHWGSAGRERLEGVSLILSAGDLKSQYLEFLVTMLNVPCLYVRGNHDSWYDTMPPQGCLDIDGQICEVELEDGEGKRILRIAGLGGSMRYREGSDMYTEKEMTARMRRLKRAARRGYSQDIDTGRKVSAIRKLLRRIAGDGEEAAAAVAQESRVDIFLTHAPCRGYGDMEDLPHNGFACFNDFLEEFRPAYHCYGHVHMEYGNFSREIQHPSGTKLINVSGMYILEI